MRHTLSHPTRSAGGARHTPAALRRALHAAVLAAAALLLAAPPAMAQTLTPSQARQVEQYLQQQGGAGGGAGTPTVRGTPASGGGGAATAPLLGDAPGGRANPTPAEPATPGPRVAPGTPLNTANLNSEVFGAQLFTGAFAREGATLFNPDYVVTTGDTLQVRLWGAFNFDALLTVDPQGNIFLPNVGPVAVRGVRNAELQPAVEAAVRRVYRANVFSYASLAEAQPVRVFVSGFVPRPGLYAGTSMDSLLHYLDQAGGIDTERGSFLDVQVQRGNTLRGRVNLYDFLLQGRMPTLQLASGDVIFVPPRQNTVLVRGLAANAKRFEFTGVSRTVADFIALAKPQPAATHVRVVRNTGTVRNTEYYPLSDAASVAVANGDELEFTADKKPGTITVRVEGEHDSPQEYVLPYGSKLGDLVSRIRFNERSQPQNVQLFRQSVKQRQKELLATSLRSLETALLTARSGSGEEASLRTQEANLSLQWVERAKQIEPLGQVLIAQNPNRNELLLENGDVLRVPTKDGLVLVNGEVLFPNSVAHEPGLSVAD